MSVNDRIERKLDDLSEKVTNVSEQLSRNSAVLEEHQRRSVANEKAVELLRSEVDPIKQHVAAWAGAGKVGAIVSASLLAVAAVVSIYLAFK